MSNVHRNFISTIKINLSAIKSFVTFLRTQVDLFGMIHFWQRYCLFLKKTYLPIPPTKQLAISTKIADRPNKRSLLSCRRWFNLSPGSFQTKSSLSGSIKDLFFRFIFEIGLNEKESRKYGQKQPKKPPDLPVCSNDLAN